MSQSGSILFLTQTAHPLGGVENWLEYLVPGLERLGWAVTVGLVRGRRHHDPAEYLRIHPYAGTIEVPALTGTPEGRRCAIVGAIHQKTPDIVVPVNVGDTLEAVRRIKAGGQTVRILYPLHGDSVEYFRDLAYYKGCLDFAVATNRLVHAAIQSISGLSADRTAHVAYGAPPPLEPPSDRPSQKLRLAFVGRLVQEQKRVLDLPAVCNELDRRGLQYHLDIAGTGSEEPRLRHEMQAQVAAGRVLFHGFCSRDELYQRIYPGLTALVLLSDWETGPIVAWEAMLHGATVATTDYRGRAMEGLLLPEINSLVSPVGDAQGLAANLQRMADDADLRARLRQQAYRTAKERCSIEASVQGWHKAFQSCLAGSIAMDLPTACPVPFSGRLDRLLGIELAETVRSLLGRGMIHGESGGEWPHALISPGADEVQIAQQLAALDSSETVTNAAKFNSGLSNLRATTRAATIETSSDQ